MWFVERIGVVDILYPSNSMDIRWTDYLTYIISPHHRCNYVQIYVRDDETGESERVIGSTNNWKELDELVCSMPYGVVEWSNPGSRYKMFNIQVVDSMCAKFLCLVENVREFPIARVPSSCISHDRSLVAADKLCSFVKIKLTHDSVRYFPLLWAILHNPSGWGSDRSFYLMCTVNQRNCMRLTFTDFDKAKLFVSKAGVAYGCDPILRSLSGGK